MPDTMSSTNDLRTAFLPTDLIIGKMTSAAVTIDQLVFLGRDNLNYLKQQWQRVFASATPLLEQLRERADLLEGKSVQDLKQIASQYDYPNYPTKMSSYHSGQFLDTEAPESLKRKAGSTTLNICGWCKYALNENYPIIKCTTGGNRVFRPSCGFFSEKWQGKHEEHFNHPCTLTHRGEAELERIRGIFKTVYERYQSEYAAVQSRIELLDSLIAEAEPKPILPTCRTLEHYAQGTTVYCFRQNCNHDGPKLPYPFHHYASRPNYTVVRGTVDGYVDHQYFTGEVRLQPANDPDGKPYTITCTDGRLVSFEELAYLAQHPEYAKVWLSAIGDVRGAMAYALTFYQKNRYIPAAPTT